MISTVHGKKCEETVHENVHDTILLIRPAQGLCHV